MSSPRQPNNAGTVITSRIINTMVKMLPSSQEKRGDQKLERARELALEYQSVLSQSDRNAIEQRITFAREIKVGLESKSGLPKLLHAHEYRRAAREGLRFTKVVSDRGQDSAYFSMSSGSSAQETTFDRVIKVARPLYRCYLSCEDAFPSPSMKEEWVAVVWSEACAKTGVNSNSLRHDKEFVDSSMKLFVEMKHRIVYIVESFFGFSTSRASASISHNVRLAQALVTNMTFIHRDLNIGGIPRYPYRHPVLQRAIDIMWFRNNTDDGVVFHEHFTPMPIQAMALALTVIQCCIDEWRDGTREDSDWSEERFETVYHSHIKPLTDLRDLQGGDTLVQLQWDILRHAREHAGVPFEPGTGLGKAPFRGLDAALGPDLTETTIPTTSIL